MSSVHDTERARSISNLSPLRGHSMNQEILNVTREGEERLNIPRKVRMSERRKARLAQENSDWCDARRSRISDRVLAYLRKFAEFKYDGVVSKIFDAELRYLVRTNPLNHS